MDKQILEAVRNEHDNYILPFLWMKGEEESLIRREIDRIHACGIRAFCLESRPHPQFCGPDWWRDVDIVLDEARKRNMKVYILDDVHFPTGFANGLLAEKYPERAKQYLAVRSFDVTGPVCHVTLQIESAMRRSATFLDLMKPGPDKAPLMEEKKLVSVVAMRMAQDDTVAAQNMLTGDRSGANSGADRICLTDRVCGGRITLDLPAGVWRVFVVYTTYEDGGDTDYINLIDEESVQVLIEAVYEPHYERYKEEFGKTIAGFFSDEPGFGNTYGYCMDEAVGRKRMNLPWNREVPKLLEKRLGDGWEELLPLLWFPSEDGMACAKVRYAYMDTVTELAAKNFSGQLGRWCEERGVEYIGHIIEDNNVHGRLGCGEGHYFRAMSGQAAAGIDEIGGQILPGNPDTIRHEFINFDGRFFHYLLAKLGASAALMQTNKKGRLLCETFGTYGFGLGVRDMKWIADFLIARGVNHFVPHAFSMDEYPDLDCPPHFYAGGHNPQYPYFSRLMRYCNRLCHVFSNGRWIPEVGILYHAQMEWMDDCMTDEIPAQKLHEGHIDYAIVPSDALGEICGQGSGVYTAAVEKGRLVLGGVPLKLLIVPRGRYLDPQLAQFMKAYPEVKVLFIDALPEIISEDRNPDEELLQILGSAPVTALEDLVPTIRAMGVIGARVRMHGEAAFYHYEKESGDLWMVFNESVTEPIHGNILVKLRSEDRRVYRYDAMKNRVYPVEQILASGFDEPRMLCTLELMPYESAVFFTAAPEETAEYVQEEDPREWQVFRHTDISRGWRVELAKPADELQFLSLEDAIQQARQEGLEVSPDAQTLADRMGEELQPVSDLLPAFSGTMRYTRQIEIRNPKRHYAIEAEHLYEAGRILVDEIETDFCVSGPYRFSLEGFSEGVHTVTIEVVNTPLRDALKLRTQVPGHETYVYEPSGMFGSVRLVELG